MARIPDAFIDDLLARSDIVELIASRVPLKKQGREYSARCPFHDERSPSFTVSPTKQFYHCFGCGAHGTAISFLMNYDRLEFLDAVEELARRAGIEIPREAGRRQANPDGQALYDMLAAAADFFRQQLPSSSKAGSYLRQRGLEPATCERFAVGYAPDSFDALRTTLGTGEHRMKLLERAGLLSRSESGRVYDKFRDRLLFPIHDRRGRPIAFGGRVLDKDAAPKYLNSPETELFHKGRELYGLWQVRQAHSKIPRLVVVEGYMDVVMLFQHGIETAVATLGTATTGEHAELLFRNAPDVFFCFDGDRAGRAAAWKALESVLPRMRDGRQSFFLFLPDGEDPDSIVRSEGASGFEERLRTATPLSDFLFDSLSTEVDLGTLEGRGRLAERARPLLAQIPDGAFADLMKQRLGTLTGLDTTKDAPPRVGASGRDRFAPAPRRSLVRSAIVLLLQQPALALELEPPFRFATLHQPGIDLLVDLLGLVYERPGIHTGALIEHFAGQEAHDSLHALAAIDLPGDPDAWRTEFLDAIERLDRMTVRQRLDELQEAIRAGGMSALNEVQKAELRELQGQLPR